MSKLPSLPPTLTWLNLTNNEISDLSTLQQLVPNFRWLMLSKNKISDLSKLQPLPPSLEMFCLDDNKISDVSALSLPFNLEGLFLCENPISEISPRFFHKVLKCPRLTTISFLSCPFIQEEGNKDKIDVIRRMSPEERERELVKENMLTLCSARDISRLSTNNNTHVHKLPTELLRLVKDYLV